ncbi:L,D-transpeptidase family protein [Lacticaseibacillus daqingensis]|uniref:L,D-transpeptidase family protein n=1 Tax=Lacticaseibacillus daqingensis TaxID=2486014 RepID=UPI0013DDFFB9|nr:L,D-transpeptidase family protein [Lacticaseibacillus daqingensis]
MKKKHVALIALAAGVLIAAGVYTMRGLHYQERFLPNTQVLGVNVGDKTVSAANRAIKQRFDKVAYRLTEKGQTVATVKGTELGLSRDFKQPLTALLKKQNPWGFNAVVLAGSDKADMLTVADDQKLTDYVNAFVATANKTRTAPTDAKVVDQNDQYVIEKEKAGNQLDAKLVSATLQSAIAANKTQVNLTKAYIQPAVVHTDKALTTAVEKFQAIGGIKATLTIQNHEVTVPTATLHQWISYENGAITVNDAAVKAFLQDINTQYATYTKTRQFTSTMRGVVSVPAGIYGWSIPTTAETPKVVALIKAGKDFTHALAHVGTGYHEDGTDIGNTYIEVDKANQHEWFYKDGQLVMDTAVVTGKPSTPTPSGVFSIWSKQRNATLNGEDYSTPVSYWMPIDSTGVGLHDSSWQPQYGGTWYQTHGSHGCVNNPPAFIANLYNAVALGTPVIVF